MKNVIATSVIVSALVVGGGSLLLFGYFLLGGTLSVVTLVHSETGRLAWDFTLSMIFFLQHSGMIRRPVRSRLATFILERYYPAVYAIASGTVLVLVVVLWQPSEVILYELEGSIRWAPRLVALIALAGFAWGVSSLGSFDVFGIAPIRLHLRGKQPRPPEFVVRGPYCYVRHPLYFFMLVLFWSTPQLTPDRLLFNLLWTAWVVVGTLLEERGLVAEFGNAYREYQRRVPMLVPWRPPLANRL